MKQPDMDKRPLALVVDDDAMLRLLAVRALKKAGISTCEAVDGEDALVQFSLHSPDIILLDIEMPRLDGFAVCRHLRAGDAGRHVPIMVMTGHEDHYSVDQAYDAGATDFISKPVNWQLLGHRVRYMLRNATLYREAQKQRELLEQAEDIARLGNWQWSFESGDVLCSNGIRKLFGLGADASVAMDSLMDRLIPVEQAQACRYIASYPDRQSPLPFEQVCHIESDHGEELVVQVIGKPCFDADGKMLGAEGTMQDITGIVRLEEEKKAICDQLEHAQRMESLGIMTGGIAHDFNNMLAAIMSNLYLARMMARGNPALEKKLGTIEDICSRAAAVIRAMLTFARNDHVRKTTVDMRELMDETCTMLQSGIPGSITLKQEIDEKEMPCMMNKAQIQQVLMNMVNNAQFAVHDVAEAVITLTASHYTPDSEDSRKAFGLSHNKWLRLQVKDNGSGITPENMGKLFEPFFTTKEVGQGTGLGLSMAYGAIESHGGFIDVSSEPGEGTVFSIYLPRTRMSVQKLAESSDADHFGQGETILIVDDNDDLRIATASVLNKLGYKTLVAANGKEAIATYNCHKDHVALILMDVVMPVLGGISAAQEVRRKDKQVPIVFITGNAMNSMMVKEVNIINSQVVSKPFTMQAINQLIGDLLHPAST